MASSQSGTFGLKTPGSTCALAPICSPWTRALPSSMSQVRDWHRSLSHCSLSSFECHLSVYPPVHDSCMFLHLPSLLLFFFFATWFSLTTLSCPCNIMAYFPLSYLTSVHLEMFLVSCCGLICLLTNQTASASSYCLCPTFYARKQYSL